MQVIPILNIIEIAEKMVDQLPVVSSKPLAEALRFTASIDDFREYSDGIVNLMDAMNNVNWSYFPNEEQDSDLATVDIYDLLRLKKMIARVRKFELRD